MRAAFVRSAGVGLLSLLFVLTFAHPASAHGVGGLQPTNYRTNVEPDQPGLVGIAISAIDLGERLELINRTSSTITVIGYEGEPYLRIGPDGVFENRKSPATYLNKTTTPTGPPPAIADPSAPPDWRRISTTSTARWHDHRAHWMGSKPAVVRKNPTTTHVLTTWSIPLQRDGVDASAIRGTITWVPPASPWPWVGGAIAIAGALALLARLQHARVWWVIALAIAGIAEGALFVGTFRYVQTPLPNRISVGIYNIAAIILIAVTLFGLRTSTKRTIAPLVMITGLVLFLGTGIPGFSELSASQLPTLLPPGWTRTAIMSVIGIGFGLIVGAAQFLRIEGTPRKVRATNGASDRYQQEIKCASTELRPPPQSASPPFSSE